MPSSTLTRSIERLTAIVALAALALSLCGEATKECVSPTSDDCLKCCNYDREHDGCSWKAWGCGKDTKDKWCQGERWYSSVGFEKGKRCSEIRETNRTSPSGRVITTLGCGPPCAKCTDPQRRLPKAKPSGCDCNSIDIGVDPCFFVGSCPCFCSRVASLLAQCPHLKASVDALPEIGPLGLLPRRGPWKRKVAAADAPAADADPRRMI